MVHHPTRRGVHLGTSRARLQEIDAEEKIDRLRTQNKRLRARVRRLQAELLAAQPAVEAVRKHIEDILSRVRLTQTCWEDREDIMCFNGEPIGGTLSTRHPTVQIGRWWPALQVEIAKAIADAYGQFRANKTREEKSDGDTDTDTDTDE